MSKKISELVEDTNPDTTADFIVTYDASASDNKKVLLGRFLRNGIDIYVDGVLVEAANVAAWTRALRTLATEPERLARLRDGIQPPRTMTTAAAEMAGLYRRLLENSAL